VVSFNLSELLGSLFEPAEVGQLHVLGNVLLALLVALERHLLPRLLELHLAPLKVAVDAGAQDGDLAVQLIILPLIELGLESIDLGGFQLLQLLVYL